MSPLIIDTIYTAMALWTELKTHSVYKFYCLHLQYYWQKTNLLLLGSNISASSSDLWCEDYLAIHGHTVHRYVWFTTLFSSHW